MSRRLEDEMDNRRGFQGGSRGWWWFPYRGVGCLSEGGLLVVGIRRTGRMGKGSLSVVALGRGCLSHDELRGEGRGGDGAVQPGAVGVVLWWLDGHA